MELRPIIAALWTQPKFFEAIVGQVEALPHKAPLRLPPLEITVTFRWSCFPRIAHLPQK